MGQIGFYFDQTRCSGCYTCILACKQWHSIEHEAKDWRRVETLESGTYPDLKVSFLSPSCLHCKNPPCLSACPASAISKRKDNGVVQVDSVLCLGESHCGLCRDACPYGIPVFGADPEGKMEKCDLCVERVKEGRRPICVEACPMGALDSGPVDELLKKYGHGQEMEGFTFFPDAGSSLVFKGKK